MVVIRLCCFWPTYLSYPSLICDFCPSDRRFAYSFLQILPHDRHPCCSAIHFPLSGHVRDLHPLERAHGAQTKKGARCDNELPQNSKCLCTYKTSPGCRRIRSHRIYHSIWLYSNGLAQEFHLFPVNSFCLCFHILDYYIISPPKSQLLPCTNSNISDNFISVFFSFSVDML